MNVDHLRDRLKNLEGQNYKAYRTIVGIYTFPEFSLHIDFIQADPFAAPSRLSLSLPQTVAQLPPRFYNTRSRQTALEDFLARRFCVQAQACSQQRGSGNSGLLNIIPPSQAILPRTAVRVSPEAVDVRFTVGLPALGRRIAGYQAASLLCEDLPKLVTAALRYVNLNSEALQLHCDVAENADWLRSALTDHNLVGFVADGAVLPRRSGIDDRPLLEAAIPFESPDSLRVSFLLPTGQPLTGMGIPAGVTLIVGGGYHGKSTLLRALQTGIYTHIPGDGREYVVTAPTALKIRAEEGRSVGCVNISPFINQLPQGQSTEQFSTANASGSTSQAASILEGLEAGAQVLLIDEDTSATNFMIRDQRMQALIAKEREPITPFIDKVRQLYCEYGVSTILVMGGSGDYFDVADTVIALDSYQPKDVTQRAHAIAAADKTQRQSEGGTRFGTLTPRGILPESICCRKGKHAVSWKVSSTHKLRLGTEDIDLSALEQLVEPGQLNGIAAAIVYAQRHYLGGQRSLQAVLQAVAQDIETHGLDCLEERSLGELVGFRQLELAATLNRLRTLKVFSVGSAEDISAALGNHGH